MYKTSDHGVIAYFSNDFCIKSKMDIIDHDTTINYCELDGIIMVLKTICQFIDYCNNQHTVTYKFKIIIH